MRNNQTLTAGAAPGNLPESSLHRTNDTQILRPTVEAYQELETAFDFFNLYLFVRLFDVQLPNVMLTMPKNRRYQGYFQHQSWNSKERQHVRASEITLSPYFFDSQQEVCQTLAHEMVHLAQAEYPDVFGEPSPRGYHNKRFAQTMIGIGLMPSSTGRPGGKTTGVCMGEYVVDGGPFAFAYERFVRSGYEIRWSSSFVRDNAPDTGMADRSDSHGSAQDREREHKRRSKTKYSCAVCGLNAWAKPQAKLACVACATVMQEAKP